MKLAHYLWPTPIVFEENRVQTLVTENPVAFRNTVEMLLLQCSGEEGEYVLSRGLEPVAISKSVEMITDFFNLDCNQKRLVGKLHKAISAYAMEEKYIESAELLHGLKRYLAEIFECSDHGLSFDEDFNIEKLLKAMDVKIETEAESFLEKLLDYMAVVCEFRGTDTFFFVNLKCFLSDEELEQLGREVMLRKYHVLLLENTARETAFDWEDLHIIDNDLCYVRF